MHSCNRILLLLYSVENFKYSLELCAYVWILFNKLITTLNSHFIRKQTTEQTRLTHPFWFCRKSIFRACAYACFLWCYCVVYECRQDSIALRFQAACETFKFYVASDRWVVESLASEHFIFDALVTSWNSKMHCKNIQISCCEPSPNKFMNEWININKLIIIHSTGIIQMEGESELRTFNLFTRQRRHQRSLKKAKENRRKIWA